MKPIELFNKVAELDEGSHELCDIYLMSDSVDIDNPHYRIYHHDGYCFEIYKQQHCESDEIEDYSDIHELQEDGATYHFEDMGNVFDGFKECELNNIPQII